MARDTECKAQVTLYVDRSRNAREYAWKESFFQEETKRALKIFQRLLEEMSGDGHNSGKSGCKNTPRDKVDPVHQTIGVFGPRGTGKTSFMLSLKGALREKEDLCKQLHIIGQPIDPSLVESKEYFLLTIISLLCKEVEECVQSRCHLGKEIDPANWNKALNELARHLVALDDFGEKSLRDLINSPEIFAQEALRVGRSGRQLAEAFHKFVNATIKMLKESKAGLKSIVLFIDDIDMALKGGWQVMETMRKYLTTRQLIVIASGDLNLYRQVVHLEQRRVINDMRQNKDWGAAGKTGEILGKVEYQYLTKLFPIENRIYLKSITTKITEAESVGEEFIQIVFDGSETKWCLSTLFRNLCNSLFWAKPYSADQPFGPWNDVFKIFPENARELIRLVDLVLRHCGPNEDEKFNSEDSRETILNGLLDCLDGIMREQGLDTNRLRKFTYWPDERWLFKWLMTDDQDRWSSEKWPKGERLEPLYQNSHKDRAILGVQAVVTEAIRQNPNRIGEYWTLVAEPALAMADASLNQQGEKEFINFIRYPASEGQADIVARISDYFSIHFDEEENRVAPGKAIFSESDFGKLTGLKDHAQLLVDLCSFRALRKQGLYQHVSFVHGLAGLLEALFAPSVSAILTEKREEEEDYQIFTDHMARARQVKLFTSRTENRRFIGTQSESNSTPRDKRKSMANAADEQNKLIFDWRREFKPDQTSLTVKDIAAIWRRFHYGLIDQAFQFNESASVGKVLFLSAQTFLNAVLVEEARALGFGETLYRNNIGTDQSAMLHNLTRINELESGGQKLGQCKLFHYWITCPLMWMLIPRNHKNSIRTEFKKVGEKGKCILSFWNKITQTKPSIENILDGIKPSDDDLENSDDSSSANKNEQTVDQ